ncbi:MAG: CBS domain-containing protein [Caldilineaceae bacterium]|nr:CBS domain-containing protein [Caldilineaceae bacterium]MCB0122618.1 CBS domain-containing protein [Caldilineaceae bacterium]
MHRLPVTSIMQQPVITIHPEAAVTDAAELMEDLNIRRLPVIDENDCLVGIVTDTDVLEAETANSVLSSYERSAEGEWLTVADIMTREVITIAVDAKVGELAIAMMTHKIGGLPVVQRDDTHCNQQRVVGIVTETDIFRMIADAWHAEVADITP